jgi:hypothetical protein
MPLPGIISGKTARCTAKCKARGDRCRNPAAWGCSTCRYHGARMPPSIRRGEDHPAYRHGNETQAAKQERSRRLAELRDIERVMFIFGLATGPRWRGRKPKA